MKVKEESEKAGLKLNIQNEYYGIRSHHLMANRWGNSDSLYFWAPKSLQMVTAAMTLAPWKKSYEKSRQHIKEKRHHFADKGLHSQSYDFSSSHVQM